MTDKAWQEGLTAEQVATIEAAPRSFTHEQIEAAAAASADDGARDQMMYLYQSELLCEACGQRQRGRLDSAGLAPADPLTEHTYQSDDYPKGPYGVDGLWADAPAHCAEQGGCLNAHVLPSGHTVGRLLGKLSRSGIAYARLLISGGGELTDLWAEYYREQLGAENGDR